MARKQDLGGQLLEVPHRLGHEGLVEGADEVVAAHDGVERDRGPGQVESVLGGVDDARVTAASEDDDSFPFFSAVVGLAPPKSAPVSGKGT